jgi:hypothetical protein
MCAVCVYLCNNFSPCIYLWMPNIALGKSDYIVFNSIMEWVRCSVLSWMRKEMVLAWSEVQSGIWLAGLRKSVKNTCQDDSDPGWNPNRAPTWKQGSCWLNHSASYLKGSIIWRHLRIGFYGLGTFICLLGNEDHFVVLYRWNRSDLRQ